MPRLPAAWSEHLESGTSQRLGGVHADGRPSICRCLAARALADGRIELLAAASVAGDTVAAIAATGRVAYLAGRPDNARALHVKGDDAELFVPDASHADWFMRCGRQFVQRLRTLRADADGVLALWYGVPMSQLWGVRFTPRAAFDQTPGPGAGQALALLQGDAPPPRDDAAAPPVVPAATVGAALTLRESRRLLEGVVPPAMCSVDADGVPHLNFLSHAEWVDDEHVALTYQFLNRSRANVLATGRVALQVDDPMGGTGAVLTLRYRRTETAGPVFERLRVKLAGIAAHTGMEKVFHLRGADLYRVEAVRPSDAAQPLPSIAPRCDLAAGVRRVSQQLADAPDLRALLQVFIDGVQRELAVKHAIVWLQDECQPGTLYTLASVGYPHAGSGAEMSLADSGLVGVALRENVPIRIGQVCQMLRCGLAARARVEQLGLQGAMQELIPLPGLDAPCSQLAVPLRARGRAVGALLLESEHDQFFSYDDEDALTAVAAQLAQGLAALRAAELAADKPTGPLPAPPSPGGRPLRIRHYPRDHSVFVDDQYLIKGVAGAIVAKLVRDQLATGRSDFSTRALRLAGDDLRLPEVQDNLGVRLLMLERRLAERDLGLRIERTGRGHYRLIARGPLEIVSD